MHYLQLTCDVASAFGPFCQRGSHFDMHSRDQLNVNLLDYFISVDVSQVFFPLYVDFDT